MAMREHKEATTQEIPCVVASFFISWHRQVETPGQISRRSYRPLGQSKSQANRLGSSGSALAVVIGFEPPPAKPLRRKGFTVCINVKSPILEPTFHELLHSFIQ